MQTPHDVRVEVDHRPDGIDLARTFGELDANSVPYLRDQLARHLGTDHDFILDFARVTFLGSNGLQVLVDTNADAERRNVRWALVSNHRIVTRPLEVTGLASQLPLKPSVAAAVDALTVATA